MDGEPGDDHVEGSGQDVFQFGVCRSASRQSALWPNLPNRWPACSSMRGEKSTATPPAAGERLPARRPAGCRRPHPNRGCVGLADTQSRKTQRRTSSCLGRSGISKDRSVRNALATSRSFQISAAINDSLQDSGVYRSAPAFLISLHQPSVQRPGSSGASKRQAATSSSTRRRSAPLVSTPVEGHAERLAESGSLFPSAPFVRVVRLFVLDEFIDRRVDVVRLELLPEFGILGFYRLPHVSAAPSLAPSMPTLSFQATLAKNRATSARLPKTGRPLGCAAASPTFPS